MFDPVGFTAYALDAVLLFTAWCVLALLVALLYGRACRFADKQAREDEEMREFLAAVGRDELWKARTARMIANADALARDVQYARQTALLNGTVWRAPLLADEDIDSIPRIEVG